MPGEVALKSGSGGAGRHDLRQRPIREGQPQMPMPVDPPKDVPLGDRRRVEPAAQRPDRTRRFFSSKRNGDARARARRR